MDGGVTKSRSSGRSAKGRAAGIRDVARLAGVSTATVSRALASPDLVTPETRARVHEAIGQTGYVPNPAARSLRSQKTNMILVVLPDLANTFFSSILRGMEQTLFEAGYGMIVSDLDGQPEKEAHFAAFTAAGRVDGAILLNGHLLGEKSATRGGKVRIPLVALCEAIPEADIPQIEVDNRIGARTMVAHLASLGHQRIAYVSGPPGNVLELERANGYREGLEAAGLAFDSDLIIPGDYTLDAGTAAGGVIAARRNKPTAVFCTSDVMAIGVIRALAAAGLRVPEDISVAGFDDVEFAAVAEPPLTTIRQPRRELGEAAARTIIGLLRGEAPPRRQRLKTELVIRSSVKALAETRRRRSNAE
jgi:LacI family repressor for deo operon, udp, cdd, tsx, nupC, and nupG